MSNEDGDGDGNLICSVSSSFHCVVSSKSHTIISAGIVLVSHLFLLCFTSGRDASTFVSAGWERKGRGEKTNVFGPLPACPDRNRNIRRCNSARTTISVLLGRSTTRIFQVSQVTASDRKNFGLQTKKRSRPEWLTIFIYFFIFPPLFNSGDDFAHSTAFADVRSCFLCGLHGPRRVNVTQWTQKFTEA